MNLLSTPEFKVGLLVVAISTLIGYMSLKVSQNPRLLTGSKEHHFIVDNAGGLVKNSAVKMAGIQVGTIADIVLEEGRAKVIIRLDKDVQLTSSSKIELRSDGILGDRHVEIVPGDSRDVALPSGAPLPADGQGGLDNIMREVGDITKSLKELAENLNRATKGDGDGSSAVGRIVLNIEKLTQDLATITDANTSKINNIIQRIDNLTASIDDNITGESLSRVNRSLRNIEEITEKVNQGEGTLGKLINDDTTVDEFNTAVSNINEFLNLITRLETTIDVRSEVFSNADVAKTYLGVRIQPGVDRYYELQVIDDPRGVPRRTITSTSIDGGPLSTVETTTTEINRLKFTGLFAKSFYNLTLKGGIIENSGGIAFDYYFLNKDLRLSAEFYQFSDLYVRAFARYNLFKGIYLTAGGDNFFAASDGRFSPFFGAGLFLTNDDLRLFILSLP